MSEMLVGIDFGTSTSLVTVKRYDDYGKPIGGDVSTTGISFGGNVKAETIVRKLSNGDTVCGAKAENDIPDSKLYKDFKMRLESSDTAEKETARELTEAFIKYLYSYYGYQKSNIGEADDKEKTIVSYPVKWSRDTRDFMIKAAEKAGFKNVESIDEATAALYAVLCRQMSDIAKENLLKTGENGYIMLIDMGAGTTDIAISRYFIEKTDSNIIHANQIKNEIITVWPNSADSMTFGGREIDKILEDYIIDYVKSCGLPDETAQKLAKGSGSETAKTWKEKVVSALLNDNMEVTTCAYVSNILGFMGVSKSIKPFGRAAFTDLIQNKLNDFISLVNDSLIHAAEENKDFAEKGVDIVILTGGHSSWYFVNDVIDGTIEGVSHPALDKVRSRKSRIIRLANPQETVSAGLVYSKLPFAVVSKRKEKPAPIPTPTPTPTPEPITEQEKNYGDVYVPDDLAYESLVNEFIMKYKDLDDFKNIFKPIGNEQLINIKKNFIWGKPQADPHLKGLLLNDTFYIAYDAGLFKSFSSGWLIGKKGLYTKGAVPGVQVTDRSGVKPYYSWKDIFLRIASYNNVSYYGGGKLIIGNLFLNYCNNKYIDKFNLFIINMYNYVMLRLKYPKTDEFIKAIADYTNAYKKENGDEPFNITKADDYRSKYNFQIPCGDVIAGCDTARVLKELTPDVYQKISNSKPYSVFKAHMTMGELKKINSVFLIYTDGLVCGQDKEIIYIPWSRILNEDYKIKMKMSAVGGVEIGEFSGCEIKCSVYLADYFIKYFKGLREYINRRFPGNKIEDNIKGAISRQKLK